MLLNNLVIVGLLVDKPIVLEEDGKKYAVMTLTLKDTNECIDIYIHYLKRLREISDMGYNGLKVCFRDMDRFLYDFDKLAGNKITDKTHFDDATMKGVSKQLLATTECINAN